MNGNSNIRALLSGILLLGLSYPAGARQSPVQALNPVPQMFSAVEESGHFCGTDFTSPGAREAMAAYREARRNGALPGAQKQHSPPDIGDERAFNVREPDSDTDPWKTKTFRLVDKQETFYFLWVDVAELSEVSPSDVEGIKVAFLEQTPASSIEPGRGILANNHRIFGPPPDYDQDGMLDLLLYDIGSGSGSTIGYVSAVDIAPNVPDSVGNQADILYLDSEANVTTLAVILAHEYTHLIHLRTGWDFDFTFNTEGYAEYSMVMNGYPDWRPIRYLEDPEEYQRPLFDWRAGGGPQARDYQRGSLFFSYIAEQHQPETIGRMLQSETKGPDGVDEALQFENASLLEIIRNFHTANFLNDRSIDPRFGHGYPSRQNIRAVETRRINGELPRESGEGLCYCFDVPLDVLNGGAVKYIVFDDVADLNLKIDAVGYEVFPENIREQIRITMQNRIQPRLIGELQDGSIEIFDIVASADYQHFSGNFRSLTLIVAQVDPGVVSGKITYAADWTPLSQATDTDEEISLPNSIVLRQNYPNPFNPQTRISFTLNRPGQVRLAVFDLLGREIRVLVDGFSPAGNYDIVLDARDWPSGTYLYRLNLDDVYRTQRMVLTK